MIRLPILLRALVVSACIVCFLTICAPAAESGPSAKLEQLRRLRKEAAGRKRRMIFNNDGDDVIYHARIPTAEALLAVRTTPLLGSQVDSIFYSNSLCFGQSLHKSEVFEPFTCREATFKPNILPALMEKGIDPIKVMTDFCHEHGIEIFWDMRMNDTHDSSLGGYGPYLRPKLKLDNPQYIVGARDKHPPHGTWTSIDYTRPEVRELAYRFFEEVCRKFDVDGLEMDFFRHACFFRSVAWGGKASSEELEMMTGLVRRIRQMSEREGLRRGRPILIAIRVPDSLDFCRGIGLDVQKWLAEGLVDILIGSGYFRLNRWEYLVELGHRHHLPVYPCLSESRVRGDNRFGRNSLESYRGRALRAWEAGADGIYMFNYFDPRSQLWRELGDRNLLKSMDKLYFVTVRNSPPDRYLAGGSRYRHLPMLTPSNVMLLPVERPTELELVIGDDLSWATEAGLAPKVTCHVQVSGGAKVAATLNGRPLGNPAVKDDWLDFPVPSECVKKGANRLALLAPPAQQPPPKMPQWTLVYDGAKPPAEPWQKTGFAGKCLAEVRDGRLLIADRDTVTGSYAFFTNRCSVRPSDRTVFEVRLKPISGWSSVMIENGVSGLEVQFFTDKVVARGSGLSYTMDTTDAFHTYRIAICDKDFQLFVDGVLRIDGAGKFTQPASGGRSGVMFGAANSGSLGEALWESVKLHNAAQTIYDAVLSIRYKR